VVVVSKNLETPPLMLAEPLVEPHFDKIRH
jgi:hypothetical protein